MEGQDGTTKMSATKSLCPTSLREAQAYREPDPSSGGRGVSCCRQGGVTGALLEASGLTMDKRRLFLDLHDSVPSQVKLNYAEDEAFLEAWGGG